MLREIKDRIHAISHHTDALLALGVIGLILLLIIPLPSFLLDTLLSLSIVLAVMTLLLTIFLEKALEFSAFPSLLLFLTLFRLGLNISSTRMILTHAEAGDIIRTFGNFVTHGNTFVGLVIFTLLTVINFTVVTKGAGRIAEVAARFTLEALPGKQMAVDSELTAGLLTHEEARRAREQINGEADFYGAMDGASKFVRGDAIAGIVITCVNIVGGIIVGIFIKGLSLKECITLFTRLTVGDGLVSQIPALLISVGAGIIVTRAANGSVGRALPKQIMGHPKVLAIAALVLLALSFVPGMPMLVMIPIAATLLIYAYVLFKERAKSDSFNPPIESKRESLDAALALHPIEVILGYKLLRLSQPLLAQITPIRKAVAAHLGIVLPSIHIGDAAQIPERSYQIKLKGVTLGTYFDSDLPAIVANLTQVIECQSYKLINRQDVARMIEKAKAVDPAVVDELIPNKMTLGQILKVLQNLLRENISIRDFVSILEVLADNISANGSPDPDLLTEQVRVALSSGIAEMHFGKERVAHAITFDSKVEKMLSASLFGNQMVLRPETAVKIRASLATLMEKAAGEGKKAVVLTAPKHRRQLRLLIENELPALPVISFHELSSDVQVACVGTLDSEVLI